MAGAIDDIPRHRLFAPDTDLWGKAGMLAGKALRLGRIPPGQGQERKLLNDSLIYLQARKVGAAVLHPQSPRLRSAGAGGSERDGDLLQGGARGSMKYQLVLQWSAASQEDHDAVIAMNDD